MAGVAALRLYYTTRPLAQTGDLVRHLCYGTLVGRYGFGVAGRTLDSLPLFHLAGVSWSFVPYNYPIVTLAFFSGVAALLPSLFFARFALTLIEAANAALVWRASGSRWLAALYWAAPVSIWWVSREGQFEPLQNLFVLAALCLLKSLWPADPRSCCRPYGTRRDGGTPVPALKGGAEGESSLRDCNEPAIVCKAGDSAKSARLGPLAFLLLALGVQVKLSALFLLPLFLITVWRTDRRRLFACLLAFLGGLIPTLLALQAYPILNAISGSLGALNYNPYYVNPFDKLMVTRHWTPAWLALLNAAVTWPLLLFLAWRFLRSSARWELLAPLLFLIAIKTHANVQFWYMVLWPAFVLPISDRRLRWTLFALYPLLDVTSTLALLGHPLGPLNPPVYQTLNVFKSILP